MLLECSASEWLFMKQDAETAGSRQISIPMHACTPASPEGGRGTRFPPYTMPALLASDTAFTTLTCATISADGGLGAPREESGGGGRGTNRVKEAAVVPLLPMGLLPSGSPAQQQKSQQAVKSCLTASVSKWWVPDEVNPCTYGLVIPHRTSPPPALAL
eukprot:1153799-Pelagomonas_calceolata.AAC.4